MPTIEAVPGGWAVNVGDSRAAFIEAGSFVLADVRFRQDGRKLLHKNHLAFPVTSNNGYPYMWADDFKVKITQGESPEWSLDAVNAEGTASVSSKLRVRAEGGAFFYRVSQSLTALKDYKLETFNGTAEKVDVDGITHYVVEFTDPYYMHAAGPAVKFEGHWPGIYCPGQEADASEWRKRWSVFAYEKPDGRFDAWRHNHNNVSGYVFKKIERGGRFVVFDDPEGNVAHKFLTNDCYIWICLWGYDAHLGVITPEPVLREGRTLSMEYEFFEAPPDLNEKIRANLDEGETSEWMERSLDVPVYVNGVNSFDKKLSLLDHSSIAWQKSAEGAVWDKTAGHGDDHSLKLVGGDGAEAHWQVQLGQENFTWPLYEGRKYLLRFHAKTKLTGGVLTASVRFASPRWPGICGRVLPPEGVRSVTENGDSDWKMIELVTPEAPKNVFWAHVTFKLAGPGTAWIDDVTFSEIK
ncbi:MAG: hypothetical protein FWF03_03675 [Defluviitaleaceae bacterium]|nr:hypothetical protein [Defluviitaleaceae bacterium]